MNSKRKTNNLRLKRAYRVRAKIKGSSEKPRLSVFRSHKFIYAQLIDDLSGKTLASVSSIGMKGEKKSNLASEVGKAIAHAAKKVGVTSAVFDRGRYLYHGRVKALAEGARSAGLKL